MSNGNAFTAKDDDGIRTGARYGWSYTEVAKYIGRTRNAVAGRAHRLGIIFECRPGRRTAISRYGMDVRYGRAERGMCP